MIASLLWTGFKMFYVHRSTSVTVSQLAMQMFSHDNEYHWGVRGGFGKRPYFLQFSFCTFPLFSSSEIAPSVTFCIDILRPTAIFRKSIVASVHCNPRFCQSKQKTIETSRELVEQPKENVILFSSTLSNMYIFLLKLLLQCKSLNN